MSTLWCPDDTADAAWRRWGDEFVVHHALSNDTHRLSAFAGELLVRLHDGAAAGWTVSALAQDCDADEADVEAVLDALAQLRLVRRC